MPDVKIDLRELGGAGVVGSEGVFDFWPFRPVHEEGPADVDYVLNQNARRVFTQDGVATVPLPVTPIGNGMWVREAGFEGAAEYLVGIPAGDCNLADLPRLDPKTLEPTAEPEAAWWTVAGGLQLAHDEAVQSAAAALLSEQSASGSAGAAAGSASDAAGSRSQAGTSATAAASSADAASTSAGASETSRQAADVARTSAQTARTAAEAARDAALAQSFAGVDLGTADLNTITAPGIYRQNSSANATLAANYPSAPNGGAWELRVTTSNPVASAAGLVQRMVRTWSSDAGRGEWIRTKAAANGSWSLWRFIATQRVDKTAGIAIYTWDDIALREQLVYGDTGKRDVSALLAGVTATTALLWRVGPLCTLYVSGMTTPEPFTPIYVPPTGFRGASETFTSFRENVNTGAMVTYRALSGGVDATTKPANPVATWRWSGTASWTTTDPWPTTLPGNPVGAIPNL
jgi:hypothetical protein